MNKHFNNSHETTDPSGLRALIWQMPDAEDCGLSVDLMAVDSIDRADSRSDFVLRLSQRKHLYAVVVTSHPFHDEIRLLRQFLARLPNAAPVVLVLTDCPYPTVGIDREFFAVANLNESLSELHAIFNQTAQQASLLKDQFAENKNIETDLVGPQQSMLQSGMHLRTQLADAANQSIVRITGEPGTAKSLLAKMLHEVRGGSDQTCVNFYAATNTVSVSETIRQIMERSSEPATFVLRNMEQRDLVNATTLFQQLIKTNPGSKAQVVILADQAANTQERTSIASLDLVPLRSYSSSLREIVAGIVTVYARQIPELSLSVEPDALHCMENELWPGNIRQLNLAIAGALVAGAMVAGAPVAGVPAQPVAESTETVITASSIRTQIGLFKSSGKTIDARLRVAYETVCDQLASNELGVANCYRKILNDCLLINAGLVLRVDESPGQSQIRRAA